MARVLMWSDMLTVVPAPDPTLLLPPSVRAVTPPVTLGSALLDWATRSGGSNAVVEAWSGRSQTYTDLIRCSDELAAALVGNGLHPGDAIVMWSPNCREWLGLAMAAWRIGVVVVGVDPQADTAVLSFALTQTKSRLLLASLARDEYPYLELIEEARHRLPDVRIVYHDERDSWRDFRHQGRGVDPATITRYEAAVRPNDPAFIQYTDSPSRQPYGVIFPHRSLLQAAQGSAELLALKASDVVLLAHGLHHSLGLAATVLMAMSVGAMVVMPSPLPSPAAATQAIVDHQVTIAQCTIQHVEQALRAGLLVNIDSLRDGLVAGDARVVLNAPTLSSLAQKDVLRRVFALPEVAGFILVGSQRSLVLSDGRCGTLAPGLAARVVDSHGQPVPCTEVGELCVRGPQVMLAQCGPHAESPAWLDGDGWLHTGELARALPDGEIEIAGEEPDTMVLHGSTWQTAMIDDLASEYPHVAQAKTVVPRTPRGPRPCMFVVWDSPQGTAARIDALRTHLASKLPEPLVPVLFLERSSLPASAHGNVEASVLRREAISELARLDW